MKLQLAVVNSIEPKEHGHLSGVKFQIQRVKLDNIVYGYTMKILMFLPAILDLKFFRRYLKQV